MKELMTRQFSQWASKQPLGLTALRNALDELKKGSFEASPGEEAVAGGRLFATNGVKEPFSSTALQKMRRTT